LKTADFDYQLPPERIAQTPLEDRTASRLLVLDRQRDDLGHHPFAELGDFLRPGDLLVLNRSRVIPARLPARKLPGGGKAELLLLERLSVREWKAMVGGSGLDVGRRVALANGLQAEIIAVLEGPQRIVRFDAPLDDVLPEIGQVPLPPYIHASLGDKERYQTVYAREAGSAAAPTAGLHFSEAMLENLREQGIGIAEVLLHVGLDTFAPVNEDDPSEHHIHSEWCHLDQATADAINATREAGGHVIAVGTTAVRVLESTAREGLPIQPYEGPTDLFILPGFEFKVVDAMVTNFHLPRSTLLMLVSAFAGRQRILAAYQTAIEEEYRFYSFGDAMLIL
jgi:S-adenosylmethionine:tRNA ribosyltransferase-isomerase